VKNFFRRLFFRQKPVILVWTMANNFWTYVEFQLPRNSKVLVTACNQAEYKFFDVGKMRHHVAVSGASDVGFNTWRERFDRQEITQPTKMMLEMERLFRQSRQPNTCSVLGCGRPASTDVVCVRMEIGGDFGTFSAGTPYEVCDSLEHLTETKAKHPQALNYRITPHCVRTSQ
jgi:hypothetical protein